MHNHNLHNDLHNDDSNHFYHCPGPPREVQLRRAGGAGLRHGGQVHGAQGDARQDGQHTRRYPRGSL